MGQSKVNLAIAVTVGLTIALVSEGCSKKLSNRLAGHWAPLDPGLKGQVEDYYSELDETGLPTGILLRVRSNGDKYGAESQYRIISEDKSTNTVCYALEIGGSGKGFRYDMPFCATFSDDGKTLIRNNDYSLVRIDDKTKP
jgi:hypothetical protein